MLHICYRKQLLITRPLLNWTTVNDRARSDLSHKLRKQYVYFMREYINVGHMREVPLEKIATGNQFFLPHHLVLGRKLRVFFDGSFRDVNG